MRMNLLNRSLAVVMMLVTALVFTVPTRGEEKLPDVLNLAPGDAQVVVVVRDLGGLNKKVMDFAAALGYRDAINPLAMLKNELGITEGLNESGSLLLVARGLDDAIIAGGEPEDMVLLVPVTDFKAFLKPFGAEETDGGVMKLTKAGELGFAKKLEESPVPGSGGYAVLGASQQAVATFKAGKGADAIGKSVGQLGRDYLAKNDISIYINIKSLAPALKQPLEDAYGDLMDSVPDPKDFEGAEAEMMQTMRSMMTMYFDVIKAGLRDGDGLVLGADVSSKGVGMTFTAQFKPDSFLASLFPGGESGAAKLLAKMPNESFMVAGAIDTRGVNVAKILEEFSKRMPKDGWMGKLIEASLPTYQKSQVIAGAMYTPPNIAAMFNGLPALTVIESDDPAGLMQAQQNAMKHMDGLKMNLGAGPDGQPMEFSFSTTYKQNALQINGVQIDEYMTKMNLPAAIQNQDEIRGALMMFPALTQQAGYMARVGDHVIATSSIDSALMAKGIAALKAGKGGLGSDGPMQLVRENGLPSNTSMEAYLGVGGIMQTVKPMLQLGLGVQDFKIPNNLPPAAMGASFDKGGMASRIYVPLPLIQWVHDTIRSMEGNLGGGNVF